MKKKCGRCRREFESKLDNNFCQSCIDEEREESKNSVCPRCDLEYDPIDQEYQICSHCGYDAEKQVTKPGNRRRSISRYGIDPDVRLDDWDS